MLVGSAGLGRVEFSSSSVGFNFYLWCRYFGQFQRDLADIWPNLSRYGQYLARFVEIWPDHDKILLALVGSGLDLDKISPNLVQSDGFQVNFHRIASNIAGFCMFSSKNLRISSEVSKFMIGSGCLSFRRAKPPTDLKALGFVGGDPQPTVKVSVWTIFGSGLGGLVGLVGYTGWVDSPNYNFYPSLSSQLTTI